MITTKFTSASTQEDKNFFKKLKLTPPVLGSFGLMLIYGILLLMIGYTQGGFTGITGVDPKHSVLLVLPQSIALIIGTISLKPLMERFNIRTIFLTAYSLLVVVVVLISQLDRITGIKQHQTSINTKGLVTFCVLSFLYGLFISPTSPLTSIFLSTVYTGKGRGAALGISNGFYSLGAGIIPLVASSFVIKEHNTTTTTFADVRTFYYIALGFAVLLLAVACFVSYRHTPASLTTKDMTSGVVSHQDDKMKSGKIYVTALTGIVLMFGVYMVVETFANYAFVSKLGVGVDPFGQDHGLKVTVVQAFGLFLLIQGIWRILSGTVITQFMRYRDFVLMSASLIIAAYIIITVQSRIQKNALLAFFSAVFLGVGLGSTWPIMFAYGSGINNQKTALSGVFMNTISMIMIPISELIAGFVTTIWVLAAVALTCSLILIVTTMAVSLYLQKVGLPHPDDVRQHAKKKDNLNSNHEDYKAKANSGT